MIRLLKLGDRDELILETFGDDRTPPPYAILSHTWGKESDEVTFKELKDNAYKGKAGYRKIHFCGAQARRDHIQYFWVDTCCIDKASHAELSEAITSMWRWYHEAAKCYVYLSDITTNNDEDKRTERTWKLSFRRVGRSPKPQPSLSPDATGQSELKKDFFQSRWFTRGWTLQELIAPKVVEFFSREGDVLGNRSMLEQQIHNVTQIPVEALRGASPSGFTIEERFQWANNRQTTRKEDKAYCLLGIFGVFMPLIYGEGDNAFARLKEEIDKAKPPLVSFTIPFRRDRHFVDRPDCFSQLNDNSSLPAARTALVGLGGIGKSQLAIEFCYRLRNEKPQTWVFWVHASNADRFRQGFGDIAEVLQLPGWKDPRADILGLVHHWLRNERNGKWLLVLDNVDDADFLVDKPNQSAVESANSLSNFNRQSLIEYVPTSQNGSVLFTSRTKLAALKLVEASEIIEVSPMEEDSAVALIGKKLGSKVDPTEMLELAKTLECMPLAMVQATSYIAERWPRCSIPQYIGEFEKNDRSRTSLLNYEAGQLRRDGEARNSIIITWQISFDHIYKTKRSAADLLSLISFFDRQGIPETALRTSMLGDHSKAGHEAETALECEGVGREGGMDSGKERDNPSNEFEKSHAREQFEQDILTLRQFSFVSLSKKDDTFEMHALVQLATRIWLEAHGQFEYWNGRYINWLASAVPSTGDYEDWETWKSLLPHTKTVFAQQPPDIESQKQWSEVLCLSAWYAWRMGNSLDAEIVARKSIKIRQTLYGSEHPHTLKSMLILGLACDLGGRYPEAEELHRKVLEIQKRVLGKEHPGTLAGMNSLALVLIARGKSVEAEPILQDALAAGERVLGKEHPDALTSMNNLALALSNQCKSAEAESMYRKVLAVRERVLGKEHPDTLTSTNSIAFVLCEQGKYAEAEAMHREVLAAREVVLGKEHPGTLTCLNGLLRVLLYQGKYAEAEPINREALQTQERVLGKEHPATLVGTSNLALVLRNQGKCAEAESMHRNVLAVQEVVLGKEHPETLVSVNNVAHALKGQGKCVEAIQLMEQCLSLMSRVLGVDHPYTRNVSTFLTQWQSEQREDLEREVIDESCETTESG